MRKLLIASMLLLPLAGCNFPWQTTPPTDEAGQESSRPETRNVIYRGRLLPLGTSIYMEGSHRLELEDGRFVLLESDSLVLDDYLNMEVEVFGSTRATVEAGGIIMRVERVAEIGGSSAMESSATMSSETASSTSSVAVSVTPIPVSSVRPPLPVSSAAPASVAPTPVSSVSTNDPLAAKTALMVKANLSVENWTQQYCSPSHLAFCFPVHKNWWYASFGATSSSQWHVEVGPSSPETLGDSPLSVVLLNGPATVGDGNVTVEGGMAIGQRSWTNNRHFEVRAPAALEAAVRYITQELKPAQQ